MTDYESDSKEDTECPTCGRDDFSSRRYTKIHHKRVHGDSIAGVTKECQECGDTYSARADEAEGSKYCSMDCLHAALRDQVALECERCGEEFTEKRSHADRRRFCSIECRSDWQSDAYTGEDHPNWSRIEVECDECGEIIKRLSCKIEGCEHHFCSLECQRKSDYNAGENNYHYVGTVEVECSWCGEDVEKKPYDLTESDLHFCGGGCYGAWRSENIVGEAHYQYTEPATVECLWCGGKIERNPSQVTDSGRHFCDRDCLGEWRSVNYLGEGHPRWKGGNHPAYGPNWDEQREKVRERDNYQCQGCGMAEDEHQEENGCELHVHHIRPAREFRRDDGESDYDAMNHPGNLVTLCSECHPVWEQLQLRPTVA